MTFKVGDKVRLTGSEWDNIGIEDWRGKIVTVDELIDGDATFTDEEGVTWTVYSDDSYWSGEIVDPADQQVEAVEKIIEKDDPINPSHYKAYKGIEVIQLTEQLNFNRGNAVKYIARAGLKDPNAEIEDLEKSVWYLQREIERITSAQGND